MSAFKPLRVAVVTQGFQTAGGIQTACRSLVAGLRSTGNEVVVFDLANSRTDLLSRRLASPRTWTRAPLIDFDDVEREVRHVGANGVEIEPLRYLPRHRLTRELNAFDLVHVVAGGPALGFATIRCRPATVLQVATTMSWERAAQLAAHSSGLVRWRSAMTQLTAQLERRALKTVDTVLVMNGPMAEFVTRVCATPVVMAPPGVDTSRFTPREGGWQASGHLLSLCRLNDARKGLDRLIRAYALVRNAAPESPVLVLAGRGRPTADLLALISNLGLKGHVHVRPDLPLKELPRLFREASVYVQASHEEGFGISVTEAMASGLPVVATDTAGTRETVAHGHTGWLVPQTADVSAELADRTRAVLAIDGRRMSVLARERAVSEFSDHASLDRVLRVYRGLAEPAREVRS